MSQNVRSYTDLQIIERVEKVAKGFTGWKKGVIDVWIRSNEDEPNAFDDKVYTFECKKDGERPVFIMVCSGTTNPGIYYQNHFAEYNSAGVAVACTNYFYQDSHVFGYHRASKYGKTHPAYLQNKPMYFTRDNDKDGKSENYGKVYFEIIGLNCHRAKLLKDVFRIDMFSAACLVRNAINRYKAWLAFMNKRILSVAILQEFDV